MLPSTLSSRFKSLWGRPSIRFSLVRGFSGSDVRDLFLFARRRLREERLSQVAGSLTLTTVLALVPLLTIALALFTTFPQFQAFRSALDAYFVQNVMPKGIAKTIIGYMNLFSSKATRLSAVGSVALLVTSAITMTMIEGAFNQIWRVTRSRALSQRLMMYWALLTLGPLLIGVSLTVTSQLFMTTSSLVGMVPFVGRLFYTTISVLVTTGAFTLLYLTVPNRYVDWHDALWGGLIAALAFEVAKRLFGVFIAQFPTYTVIYGALAAVPLLLLWIFLSWMITLMGALLVAALPVVRYERWWYQPAPGGDFVDAVAILKVLQRSSRETGSAAVSGSAIRTCTRIGFDEMTTLLDKMVALGWAGRVQVEASRRVQWGKRINEGADHWVLLANAERLTLAEVFRVFVFGGTVVNTGAPLGLNMDGTMTLDAAALARLVDNAIDGGLNQTLAAHFAVRA